MTAATIAVAFVALYAGHMLADHVIQTDADAAGKTAATGWALPMAGHLVGYGLAQSVALFALIVAGVALHPVGLLAGLAFSVATHGFIDRRWPVAWLLRHTGSANFADMDGRPLNGMYLADQSLHVACLFVAALIIGGGAA